MGSIFTKDDNFVDKPKRNTFDLSFQNNLSLKFGKLIPAYLQEVIPGDSINIDPTFGLRFLPQVFPVQTRMRAHLHFFYVRNRTIWRNWMDFIGKTKDDCVMPYLVTTTGEQSRLSESSIYDYMGLPLTIQASSVESNLYSNRGDVKSIYINPSGQYDTSSNLVADRSYLPYFEERVTKSWDSITESDYKVVFYRQFGVPIDIPRDGSINIRMFNRSGNPSYVNLLCEKDDGKKFIIALYNGTQSSEEYVTLTYTSSNRPYDLKILGFYQDKGLNSNSIEVQLLFSDGLNNNYPIRYLSDSTDIYGDGSNGSLRINALPFRAYEAVYNSFYRNPENNPFLVNGKPEYNKFVAVDSDGPCPLSMFKLYNRNWEDDAFTTAVPTPQQGDAPRVGLTADKNTPVFLNYSREDGSVGKLVLEADADGYVHAVSDSNLTGVPEVDIENSSMVNMLNDVVQFGITINDLRNVNSFQRWLEKNVRKGYRYRDQLMSHYGVSVSYKDMMMPEFIGGMSRDVTVNQISQTVETDTGNLGDMAGQAYVVGDGKRISHFCDEHGYIIGILSVAPVPNYSQMISKHFFKHDALDYFFPEFGKIGMQPITNKEIAAIASVLEGNSDNTFGYQRAWYDYLARVDEVHGKFNSEFYNFLLQRKFDGVPKLGASFTTIENDDLNNIFYTDDGEDKILGQIYYNVSGIRPIPMYGIPALE